MESGKGDLKGGEGEIWDFGLKLVVVGFRSCDLGLLNDFISN